MTQVAGYKTDYSTRSGRRWRPYNPVPPTRGVIVRLWHPRNREWADRDMFAADLDEALGIIENHLGKRLPFVLGETYRRDDGSGAAVLTPEVAWATSRDPSPALPDRRGGLSRQETPMNLSPLAAQILPMLTTPQTAHAVWSALTNATTIAATEAALDELTPHLVTCDDHEGTAYYYRRDLLAEKMRQDLWSNRERAAERAKISAKIAADRAYDDAMDKADAERDAADPMAQIKGAAQVAA